MMDALSAPPAPAPGPALQQSASGAGADQTENGSFSKVLSKSGNQEKSAAREEGQTDTSKQENVTEQTADARSKRPVIDLSSTKVANGDGLAANVADLSTDDLAQLLAAARLKTKDAKPESKVAQNADAGAETMTKAELAKTLSGLREKRPVSDDKTEIETGTVSGDEIATDDTKAADLSDVLRLLAGATSGEVKTDDDLDEAKRTDKPTVDHKSNAVLAEAIASASSAGSDRASTSDDDGAAADLTFKVVRADGKGEPMILQSDTTTRAADDAGEAATVETVTVLDARRFIAPASTTNAASITAAMLGDTEWMSAMSPGSELANAATHSSQGKVVNTLKLQMSPIELGSVTATLRLSGEELSVQLTVDNPAALRQLQNDSSDILKSLRAQGLTVDHVQVNMQVASADRSSDAGQNNLASQQQGQQTFQSGGQASDGRARGEAGSNNTRTADERVVQQAEIPSGDTRSARPDQLYV